MRNEFDICHYNQRGSAPELSGCILSQSLRKTMLEQQNAPERKPERFFKRRNKHEI